VQRAALIQNLKQKNSLPKYDKELKVLNQLWDNYELTINLDTAKDWSTAMMKSS
jgi:hypothetical protein